MFMLKGCQVFAIFLCTVEDHVAVLPEKHTKGTIKTELMHALRQ